jgi:hypothetical protein
VADQPAVLRDSFFSGVGVHGGFRRSMQVKQLLTEAGIEVRETISRDARWPRRQRVPAGLRFLATHRYPISWEKSQLGHCGMSVLRMEQSCREHRGAKVLVWEDVSSPLAPIIAREHGFRVVAVPHNLESLAGADLTPASRLKPLDRLQLEFDWLRDCDAVFAIAREECWLLANADVPNDYLPYFPPPEVYARLMQIRQRRQSTQKRFFVILGTANNPRTAAGMVEIVRLLQQGAESAAHQVLIVGDGTETLEGRIGNAPNIRLLGRLSDDALDDLLTEARGIIAHQMKGAGALTRIPESLIAGIPVLANTMASRSAWTLSGVHSYEGVEDLCRFMNSDLGDPPIPHRPTNAEKTFVDTVRRLATES